MFEVGETGLIVLDPVHQVIEKVKLIEERLKMAQIRQKSFTNVRRIELDFVVDDWIDLKVSTMKGVMRFSKNGKLSHWYVVPYRIYKKVGKVVYKLELPHELPAVQPSFHISKLKKLMGDPLFII